MYDVIYDPEKEVGALIDSDAGRALGPVLSGPADVVPKLFDSFIGAINADPAQLHPSDLDHLFRGFIETLAEDEAAPADGAAPADTSATHVEATTPEGDTVLVKTDVAEQAGAAQERPTEQAQPGEQAGLAGPVEPTEASRGEGAAPPAESGAGGVVADGGQTTAVEQARPADPNVPGAGSPASPAAGGIPKAPGA